MASDQTLSVKIDADASGLTKATQGAASELEKLQHEVQALGAESIDITAETNADAARKDLSALEAETQKLDGEAIEIPAKLDLDRINRDRANLLHILDGIERRKASPVVGMDLTQLLKDEAKVKAEIEKLDDRKIEIEARLDVDSSGFSALRAQLDDLDTNVGGIIPGLGTLTSVTKGAGVAAGIGAAAYGSWKLGELAADVETTKISLSALTGSVEDGAAAFDDLQSFAALTPFELDQVTASAQSLLGAGLQFDQIPPMLHDIGNASAALNAPLEDVTGIIGQMFLKGQVTNEEMLQLSEAHIPAFRLLADAMGISVEQLQTMASNGQLGTDKIELLTKAMGDAFPTAMQDQADSFNGKMSTMQDTFAQLGADLGKSFLPLMKQLVGVLTSVAGAADFVVNAFADLHDFLEPAPIEENASNWDKLKGSVGDAFKAVVTGGEAGRGAIDEYNAAQEEAVIGTNFWQAGLENVEVALQGATSKVLDAEAAIIIASGATDDYDTRIKNLNTDMRAINQAFDEMVANFTTLEPHATSVEEATVAWADAMKTLNESLKANGKDLRESTAAGAANRIAIAASIEAADAHARAVLAEGGSMRSALQARRQDIAALRQHAINAGLDADAVDRVVAELSKTPRQVQTELKVIINEKQINDNIAKIRNLERQKHKIQIEIDSPTANDPLARFLTGEGGEQQLANKVVKIDTHIEGLQERNAELQNLAKKRAATIGIEVPELSRTSQQLDALAAKDRKAIIATGIDPGSYAAAQAQLASLTESETKTIFVNTVNTGGGFAGVGQSPGGGTAPIAPPGANLLGVTAALATSPGSLPWYSPLAKAVAADTTEQALPRQTVIQPKVVPIKVYLDGEEIADKLSFRVAQRFTGQGSVRRRA